METNNEILIDYLDGQLNPELSASVESRIQTDKTVAGELEYLKLAIDTVRNRDAIRDKVSTIRKSFENNQYEYGKTTCSHRSQYVQNRPAYSCCIYSLHWPDRII